MKDDGTIAIMGSGVQTEELIHNEGSVSGTVDVYQLYGRMVYNVCLRVTGDYHMAEDAAQATFLIFLRKGGSLRRHSDLGGWFYQTAEFVAQSTRRGNLRRERHEPAAAQNKQLVYSSSDNAIEWNEIRPRIDGEIAQLREIYRAPIIKVYFEGKSQKEAAIALSVPEGTLRRRLFHGIQTLRKRLAGNKRELSAMLLAGMLTDRANDAVIPINVAKLANPTVHSSAAMKAVWLATSGAKVKLVALAAAFLLLLSVATVGVIHARNENESTQRHAASQEPGAKRPDLIRRTIGPWIIVSDLGEHRTSRLIDDYVRIAAAQVQAALFPQVVVREPVTLYLFKNHVTLNSWGQSQGALFFGGSFPDMSSHDAFLVHDTPNVEVLNMEAGDGFLLNRIAYQLCNADAPKAPRWLKDGLAGTFSNSIFNTELNARIGCPATHLKEYAADIENARAVGLAELFAMSDGDYRSSYDRFHRSESAAICFVQWLQCTDQLASFYATIREDRGALVSAVKVEPQFRAWLKDTIVTQQLRFEHNGKSCVVKFPQEPPVDVQDF